MSSRGRHLLFALAAMIAGGSTSAFGGGSEWYAGIDIGSKGIKLAALPIDDQGQPDLGRIYTRVDNLTLGVLQDGAFRAEAIEDAREIVEKFYRLLTEKPEGDRPAIAPSRIWIVGSSGLLVDKPTNLAALEDAIRLATDGRKTLLSIKEKREVELTLRGAIRRDQWDNSMLVDVGNGNTKFGLIEVADPPMVEETRVPRLSLKGTGGYRKEIDDSLAAKDSRDDFQLFCKALKERRNQIRKEVGDPVRYYPALSNPNRRKVFICGGSPYLIASLLAPLDMMDESKREVRLTSEQLLRFEKSILETEKVDSPAEEAMVAADKKRVEVYFRRIKDIHDERNVLVGLEILLAFDDALGWGKNQKEIYFTKAGLVAWIVGFVVEERARSAPGAKAP